MPAFTRGEHAKEVTLDSDRAEEMLGYLQKFEYASLDHVVMALLWHTMLRRGAVVALDRGEPSDVTAYTLRHSVAYWIVQERGGRLKDVQVRLRHASLSTTDQIYSHPLPR